MKEGNLGNNMCNDGADAGIRPLPPQGSDINKLHTSNTNLKKEVDNNILKGENENVK